MQTKMYVICEISKCRLRCMLSVRFLNADKDVLSVRFLNAD